MARVANMLTARRGDWTDWACYAYLALGVLLMFGPVLWLGISSLKSSASVSRSCCDSASRIARS